MRTTPLPIAALLLAMVPATVAADAATHPFTARDMHSMDRLSGPQGSPDGRSVVFVLRTTDFENNRGTKDLWLVGTDGGGPRQLTFHPANDDSPRWSPDGRSIWFLSARSGSSQVWRLPLDGGEARQVTAHPVDVTSFAVSPDGKRLAYSLEVFPDCDTIDCTKRRLGELEERQKHTTSARVYDELIVRHWDTWKDGRRSHLFVQPADGGGSAVDVMRGMDADCPSRPFGGPEEYTFTPDGTAIVFSARDAGREEAWSTNFDLYLAPASGEARPRSLTSGNPAWDTWPAFSADGRTLAYAAMRRPGYEADRFQIVLRGWPDGKERRLAADWDRSPGGLAWSADGKSIYAHADHLGQHPLFAVDVASGTVRTLVERGTVSAVTEAGGRVVYALEDMRKPADLWSIRRDGGEARQLTHVNEDRLARIGMGDAEQFHFAGWNGETVYAHVVKPVDFAAGRKYPVALLIHGGPQGSYHNDFHYRWNPQAFAGAGYAAVMVDFHGSTGYGQEFTDSIRGDWGGKPLADLKKGLAAALARNPWMDGGRVCALGASYGGYMINWIASQWPDAFRCLVNHDGNLDQRMAYFDTEELWFPEWEHAGTPWDNPQSYDRHNPIRFVDQWRTPMLVIHGALDYRVVDTQGLSTFTALQRRGIPSQLVYFPDENHWVLKPNNGIFWYESVLGWLDRWTAEKK